jgi:hypothetical protein
MIEPRTFRVACSASLVLAGALGLLVALELALEGSSGITWAVALLSAPLLAFFALLVIAVAYKRALRRSIVNAAAVAVEPPRLRSVLERLQSSEAWIGDLQLGGLRESIQKRLDELGRAV